MFIELAIKIASGVTLILQNSHQDLTVQLLREIYHANSNKLRQIN